METNLLGSIMVVGGDIAGMQASLDRAITSIWWKNSRPSAGSWP
jgi:hypothetical protein